MRQELFLLLLSLAYGNSEVNQTFILQYENYTIPDLRFVCLNFNITADISDKCVEQLEVICENTSLFATMLDATSKFPYTGLGYSSRSDYGNFDQCLSINYEYAGGRILGKHCTAGLLIPDIFGNISDPDSIYQLAICKPDACSAEDFYAIANSTINGFPSIFQDSLCQTVETGTDFTASDIVTITIFAVVILFMIVSTTYDIYLYKTETKTAHPLLLAFSVLSNGRKLLHVSKNSKEQIQTFHGLRMISMMWIVAGHGFVMWQSLSVTNLVDVDKWLIARYAQYITSSPLAVDTFFFISGFLLAFQYFKQTAKPLKDQLISIPGLYIHRYLRLTPAMLMVFMITISIFKHLGSGPTWTAAVNNLSQQCEDNWLYFFLYIQNYMLDNNDLCILQTWYLSADMQMFIISPLILIPLSLILKKPSGFKLAMIGLFILNLFFVALSMSLKLSDPDYNQNAFDTHSRLINYFIGVMLAVFMRVKQDKPFLHKIVKNQHVPIANLLVWVVILLGMLATVLCYREVELYHGYDSGVVFNNLMRPAWCIGLSWIVYSCYHGHGGVVNWILTGAMMQVMGRLTYCIYLTHMVVIFYYIFTLRTKQYFSDYNVFYVWCGHFTVSTIVSIFWTLAFESPFIIVEKYVLGGRSSKKQ